MACKDLIVKLKNQTGCSFSDCKLALGLCNDKIEIAYMYLKLKNSAVCRRKVVDGKWVPWSNADYVAEAKKIVFSC